MKEFIPEPSVSLNELFALLNEAGLNPDNRTESSILADLQSCKAVIEIDGESKNIQFRSVFKFGDDAEINKKLVFVNHLSKSYVFNRFYTAGDDDGYFVVDYFMSYGGGVIPSHILSALKELNSAVEVALMIDREINVLEG